MPWNVGLVVQRLANLCTYQAQTFAPGSVGASWDNIVYAGGEYIIVSSGDVIGYSSNGISWTFNATSDVRDPIASNGSRYVTLTTTGSEIIRSSDDKGLTWTNRFTVSTGWQVPDLFNLNGPVFSVVSNGTGFVVVGGTTGGNTTNPNVFYSSDGASWTGVHVGVGTAPLFHSVRAIGSNYYMSGTLAGNNLLHKSTDGGATWTSLPVPVTTAWLPPVVYVANGTLVYVTRETSDTTPNRIWSTTNDGTSWTEHTVPTGLRDVLYLDSDGSRIYMTMISTGGVNNTVHAPTLNGPWSFLGPAGDMYSTDYLLAAGPVQGGNFVTTEFDSGDPTNHLSIWQTNLNCAPDL